ncbi:Ferredoxin domain containing protein [Mucinivorans hirudinis]|uniref:Ferredoxin domain containing protein n=1 Tax=Mucinivorans hirudinis TaxID=1433126 RepID=A0A060RCL6_9BACT|nr:Ferredoxin domain containing protein [Mucinivorans hirudinis]
MIINEKTNRSAYLEQVAAAMMTAARTAPKAKGSDQLEIVALTGCDIKELSNKMIELSPILNKKFFLRDADNILQAEAVVLIGTRLHNQGLDCGYCGWATCSEKPVQAPCAFVMNDLGIAIGSAAAKAADMRVDSRVMFSVGVAARAMGILAECHAVMAIPISCTGKSPFFDRVVAK